MQLLPSTFLPSPQGTANWADPWGQAQEGPWNDLGQGGKSPHGKELCKAQATQSWLTLNR